MILPGQLVIHHDKTLVDLTRFVSHLMQDMQQIETEPGREHNHQVKIGKHLKT